MMDDPTLPCLACGKPMVNAIDKVENQPSFGVVCHTYGNYGSTVWDSLDGRNHLEFNVCDDCLTKAGQTGRVMHVELEGKNYPTENRELWTP